VANRNQSQSDVSRRGLLQVGAALPVIAGAGSAVAAAPPPPAEPLKIGLASYSMRKLPLEKVIELCQQARIRHVSLKDMHLPLDWPSDRLAAARAKVEGAGIVLASGGVIYMKNDGEVQRAFQYARAARLPMIIAAPEPNLLDAVEKAARELDIKVAIHNHGPEDKHYPTPKEIMALIKKRDRRMGVCMDVGHTVRGGADPIKCVADCGDRLFDLHMKDLEDQTHKVYTEVGTGVVDVVGLLRALARRRFQGNIALEYESGAADPITGIRASLAYLRGVAATLAAAS
jgi:inosose dehydratase